MDKSDHVVEVGVGFGALTCFIAESAARVTGIEIDRGLIRFHQTEKDLPANVDLIHEDILKADLKAIVRKMRRLAQNYRQPSLFNLKSFYFQTY